MEQTAVSKAIVVSQSAVTKGKRKLTAEEVRDLEKMSKRGRVNPEDILRLPSVPGHGKMSTLGEKKVEIPEDIFTIVSTTEFFFT